MLCVVCVLIAIDVGLTLEHTIIVKSFMFVTCLYPSYCRSTRVS
jgi:hypothetical protein